MKKSLTKVLAVVLSALMLCGILPVFSFADGTYNVTFTELTSYTPPADRTDWPALNQGYTLGTDYWFVVYEKAEDGTVTETEVKTRKVFSADTTSALEFAVVTAPWIEKSSVRVLAYPAGTNEASVIEAMENPNESTLYITPSVTGTYGAAPESDINVVVSPYHMYNDAFIINLPESTYFSTERVLFDEAGSFYYVYDDGHGDPLNSTEYNGPENYYGTAGTKITSLQGSDAKVVFVNETAYIAVHVPKGERYTYDKYTASYRMSRQTVDLKTADGYTDALVFTYETDKDYVDIYKVENINNTFALTVADTYDIDLGDIVDIISSGDGLEGLDLTNIGSSPIIQWFKKLISLIRKLLAGFGIGA